MLYIYTYIYIYAYLHTWFARIVHRFRCTPIEILPLIPLQGGSGMTYLRLHYFFRCYVQFAITRCSSTFARSSRYGLQSASVCNRLPTMLPGPLRFGTSSTIWAPLTLATDLTLSLVAEAVMAFAAYVAASLGANDLRTSPGINFLAGVIFVGI